jgi:CRISPR-associated protein Cas1
MAWRGLHLSRPSRLSLADGQIVVEQGGIETRLALEDLAWIVLDTPQASLTAALLSACMDQGLAVIVTDARHMPNGMVLPFHTHHRQAAVATAQLGATAALRGRLWQRLVQAKITNQAAILHRRSGDGSALLAMQTHVASDDPGNVEARAARFYWGRLFPNFIRDNAADLRNAMLNYGYAIARGSVARSLVAAGLLPAIGLHHASALNSFNLADDVIEPFRPFVDDLVWRLSDDGKTGTGSLTLAHRRALAGVLLEPAYFGTETVSLLVASEMVAAALVRALESGSARMLLMPALAPS